MQSLNGGMKIFEIIAFSIGILYIIPYKKGRMAIRDIIGYAHRNSKVIKLGYTSVLTALYSAKPPCLSVHLPRWIFYP